MALPTRPQFLTSPAWWTWFRARLPLSQPAISRTDLSSPASFRIRVHGQRGHPGQAIRRPGFTKRLLTPASSWCPGQMLTTNASLAEKCGTRRCRPWNLRWFSSRAHGGRKPGGASGHCHQRGARCDGNGPRGRLGSQREPMHGHGGVDLGIPPRPWPLRAGTASRSGGSAKKRAKADYSILPA